jgi:hypothetical protein
MTSSAGRRNGLRLEIYIGQEIDKISFLRSSGAVVLIHNVSSSPLFGVRDINLRAGTETDIIVKQVNQIRKSKPYSNCVIGSENNLNSYLYNLTLNLNNNIYEQAVCLRLCLQNEILNKCNCYDYTVSTIPNSIPCDEYSLANCSYPTFLDFYLSNKSVLCFDECPENCFTIEYGLSLSYLDFPTKFYSDFLIGFDKIKYPNTSRNFSSHEQVKSTTLAFNVFFDDISHTIIEDHPVTSIEKVVADLGGFMGLCVGTSLLTCVEIFDLLINIFYTLFSSSAYNNKNKTKMRMNKIKSFE